MDILLQATKRVQEDVDNLTIDELIKIDLYKYKNDLMNFYIKEIQKEIKNNTKGYCSHCQEPKNNINYSYCCKGCEDTEIMFNQLDNN